MIRHCVSYLLALLIALQSVIAMADTHRLYQAGTEHLEFDHSHQPADTRNNSLSLQDCNHCCHCHGQNSVVLTGTASHLAALLPGNRQANCQANLTSGIAPSLFRPPIA